MDAVALLYLIPGRGDIKNDSVKILELVCDDITLKYMPRNINMPVVNDSIAYLPITTSFGIIILHSK